MPESFKAGEAYIELKTRGSVADDIRRQKAEAATAAREVTEHVSRTGLLPPGGSDVLNRSAALNANVDNSPFARRRAKQAAREAREEARAEAAEERAEQRREAAEDRQRNHGFRVLDSLRRQRGREEATEEKAATRAKADADRKAAKESAAFAAGLRGLAGGVIAAGAAAYGIVESVSASARRNVALGAPGVALEAEQADRSLSYGAGKAQAQAQRWSNRNKFIASGVAQLHEGEGFWGAFQGWVAETYPTFTASNPFYSKTMRDTLEQRGRLAATSTMMGHRFGGDQLWAAIAQATAQTPVDTGGIKDVPLKVLD